MKTCNLDFILSLRNMCKLSIQELKTNHLHTRFLREVTHKVSEHLDFIRSSKPESENHFKPKPRIPV